MACGWAFIFHCSNTSTEESETRIWRRIAYSTRYGKGVTLSEALHIGTYELLRFNMALDSIVKEENGKKGD